MSGYPFYAGDQGGAPSSFTLPDTLVERMRVAAGILDQVNDREAGYRPRPNSRDRSWTADQLRNRAADRDTHV